MEGYVMKKFLVVFTMIMGLLAYGCGTSIDQSGKASQDEAAGIVNGVSYALQVDTGDINKNINIICDDGSTDPKPGCAVTGTVDVLGYLAELELVVNDNCKLDGKIYVYEGEALIAELDVKDNIVTSEDFPYVGKLGFKSEFCRQAPEWIPVGEDSCNGACDPNAGLFCKADVDDKLISGEMGALVDLCMKDATEQCYGVVDNPLCADLMDKFF